MTGTSLASLLNILLPSFSTVPWKLTVFKLKQPPKARSPIDKTGGIAIDVIESPMNALLGIESKPFGNMTFVIDLLGENAPVPIVVVPVFWNSTEVIVDNTEKPLLAIDIPVPVKTTPLKDGAYNLSLAS